MKLYVRYVITFLSALGFTAASLTLNAQTGVFNPSDPIVNYDSTHKPTKPPLGQVGKWVRTPRVSWNTTSFKCYIYNYSYNGASAPIAFRLKYPKNYDSTKQYAVMIFFHGDGEFGSIYDNEYQLYHGGQTHMNAVDKGSFDGFLLYPQNSNFNTTPPGLWSTANRAAVDALIEKVMIPLKMVDPFRVYVDGLSAGGSSGWTFLHTYPKLVAAFTPISAAESSDTISVRNFRFTPIFHFQGGLDNAPTPSKSHWLGSQILAVGGNYRYEEFPNRGHDCWYLAWGDPDYFPFYSRAHKANPWPLYGRTEFCPGETIRDTLGVTPGFDGYEWRKNGVLISGANSNYIVATDYGTYDCRILRGTTWSPWSPRPVVISVKGPTVQPMIMVADTGSNVIPAPDGSTTVPLKVPSGFATYNWQLDGSTTVLSTTSTLTATKAGNYKVKVTEKYGCPDATGTTGITARVQAEDFIAMSGVIVETVPDVGGGKDVGSINKYDWMDYKIAVPTAGTYNLKLRVSAPYTGAQLKFKKADGTDIITVSLPKTGSYDSYQTVSTTISLAAGLQTVRVQSTGSSNWNFNWFDVTDPNFTDPAAFSMRFPVVNANGANGPDAPTNLTATSLSMTAIQLTWNQTASPAYNETGFEIYTATASGGPYTYQVTTVADASSYTFNNLLPGTTYYYKVRAVNNNAASATVGPASATTQADKVAPTTPPNLRLGTITKYSVALAWDAATDNIGVAQYDIYINSIKSYVVSGKSTSTTVYNLVPNTNYTFAIKARDAAGNTSGFSNSVSALTLTGTVKQDPSLSPANANNYSLYINMNVDNPASAPWNNTNALPVQGQVFKNLKNYAGYYTGVTLTLVNNFSGYNPDGMNTGNNSGVYPDNVMRSAYYCDKGVVAQIQVAGLSLNHKYSFVFFGSRDGSGDRTSVYTIGTQSVSLNASYNTTNTVQIDNVVPDQNGNVFISVALGSTAQYAYLNSLVIKGYYSPGTTSSSITTTQTRLQTNTITNATVYPNPVQNDATLAVPLTQSVSQLTVQITDASGGVVSTQVFRNVPQGTWTQRLPLTNSVSQPGVYFVHISGLPNGQSQVLKLVKTQ